MIPLILRIATLARFAGECWRDTQRLRRQYPDLAEE